MKSSPQIFTTGTIYHGLKRWVKIGSTDHFATFALLRWSEDCINEQGVMYLTDETQRVKLNKYGLYYKKPFGEFRKVSDVITVKGETKP